MKNWIVEYKDWSPDDHPLREALCTLGNGYFATRGAHEESNFNNNNYPATYLAGGYNRTISYIKKKKIENEDLVNWPNWLFLSFKIGNSEWLDLKRVKVLDHIVNLNLKEGLLERRMRFSDNQNRITTIISRRIVSMDDKHVAGIEWTLIPENWEGEVTFCSGINGDVTNKGVNRYKDLNGNHIKILENGEIEKTGIFLISQTIQSKILMAQAVSTKIFQNGNNLTFSSTVQHDKKSIFQYLKINCSILKPVRVEKLMALYTSRDFAISDPLNEAKGKLEKINSFHNILIKHRLAWAHLWEHNNIEVVTDDNDILILRLHIFHIYQTVSKNSIDCDIGVPSRGWHGEAYRGHIFWDELYIFPVIIFHIPQLARSLLMYRYRRLPEARQAANEKGFRGAMFPWQSGSNGREESQTIHLNPRSGRWINDNSFLQRHINSAIPYNVWQYFQVTKDMEFMGSYGAELILSTALFWSSIAEFNPRRGRYEINGVMGPDEYHTKYPGASLPGLKNNAYTNFMAVWVIRCALDLLKLFDKKFATELSVKAGLSSKDIEKWEKISTKMYIPFKDNDIIMQFEGFDELKELNWDKYRAKYGESMRLDRILEKENDSPNNYKASKQADVLMLFYLFSSSQLVKYFKLLGYNFKPDSILKNIEYYQKITSHGSTLSQVIFSWVYSRSDREFSWTIFKKALLSDYKDVQGGTTPEGIHLGAMAGTVDIIHRCYTGLEIRDDVLYINPRLPREIREIKIHIRYRSHWIKLTINHKKVRIDFEQGWADPVEINVQGKNRLFNISDSKEYILT